MFIVHLDQIIKNAEKYPFFVKKNLLKVAKDDVFDPRDFIHDKELQQKRIHYQNDYFEQR